MMDADGNNQLCLRWTKHSDNITQSFESFYEKEALVDVTLFTEGKIIKAHKMILSACSPYFEKLFIHTADKHPVVVLKDVSYPHLSLMLDFMYRGEVNVAHEELNAFLDTAKNLCIKGLTDNIDISRDPITTQLINNSSSQRRINEISPPFRNSHEMLHNSPSLEHKNIRRMPDLYSPPSTMPSVLSKALTMPPSPYLASPLGIPGIPSLTSLPASLASSLVNHSFSGSFNHPINMAPIRPDVCHSPYAKRRRKYRKPSGEVNVESCDSDCRSSGSPGDSNLHFPKIPATITPVSKHLPPPPSSHANGNHSVFPCDLQPKDLSINSNTVDYSELDMKSPRHAQARKSSPIMIPQLLPTTHIDRKFKHDNDSSDPDHSSFNTNSVKSESFHESSDGGSSPKIEKSDLSRRSDDLHDRTLSKASSDHESVEVKDQDVMSDQEIRSEEENGERKYSSPGPSTSRPQSEDEPLKITKSFNHSQWPYVTSENPTEESLNKALNDNAAGGLWKNNFKGGLLAPYLGSFGPLSSSHSGFASTFPGLYAVTGNAAANWGKGTTSPPGLSLPQQLRSNECTRCGKLYKTRKGLKHHVKNECGVEPRFHCTHCDWKFKQKAHLLRHMARKHTVS